MNEKQYWMMLAGIFGPANPNLWKLMSFCEDPSEGYRRISDGRFQLSQSEKKMYSLWTPEKTASLISECLKKNIRIITFGDTEYPSKLRTIFNPPAVLYACGNTACLNDEVTLGVVGTRYPSQYGADAAFRISEELAKVGFTTVSGFAAGIDSACHRGTMKGGGSTVAVLGCGVDVDYPKNNTDIRNSLMENGVFISEFPPGTPPLARNFPSRNRIISGLSLGVFVVEAPLSSGALITADFASEQGRDVFCLPPSDIFSKSFQGVVRYLREGAVPVFSHLDIIYEYYTSFSHRLTPVKPSDEYIAGPSESVVFREEAPRTEKKKSIKSIPVKKEKTDISQSDLEGLQKQIAEALLSGPLHADELCECVHTDMSELLTEITDMEISGVIVSLPGKIYSLRN